MSGQRQDREEHLRARYAEGEYYEVLGVAKDTGSKDILMALMERRREYPALDEMWNAVHAALLQQRPLYESTYALRDLLAQEIADGCPAEVRKRFSKRALWKRLWKPDDPPNFLLVRLQLQQEAAEWMRVERVFAEARRQLAAECGEAVFALLDRTTNWQEVRERPETPAEFEQFILQMVQTARSSAAELAPLEIAPDEIASGQAKRAYITKAQCARCGGTHRVHWQLSDIVAQWDKFVEEHPEFQSVPPERISALLGYASVEGPCPDCTGQVVFTVPKEIKVGWVVQGRGAGNKAHFARVTSLNAQVAPPQPRPIVARAVDAPPAKPVRTLREWLEFLLACVFWVAISYIVLKLFLTPSAQRAAATSLPEVQLAALAMATAGLLWFWLTQRKR